MGVWDVFSTGMSDAKGEGEDEGCVPDSGVDLDPEGAD